MRDEDIRLTGFEAQLAALAPQATLDRDRVMFAAGERAGLDRARRASRWLAGGNLLLIVALVGSWIVPTVSGPAIATPGDPATRLATASAIRQTSDLSAPPAAVVVDAPTHLRLVQMLAGEVDAPLAISAAARAPSSTGSEISEPSEVRSLLQRYLHDTSAQL